MKKILTLALLLMLIPAGVTEVFGQQKSQSFYDLDIFGFFDNREVKSPYQFSCTYFGTRLSTDWGLRWGNHSAAAGGYVIKDFGKKGLSASDWTLYYRYNGSSLSGVFGSFPRSLLLRELPDIFVDEALRYYTPNLGGALIQYHAQRAFVELYCDWLSRQSTTEREIFEIVSDGECQVASLFNLGYNARLTHFSVRKGITPDKVYDKLMLNPYTRFQLAGGGCVLNVTAGLMTSLNRDRTDKVWKVPYGALFDAVLSMPLFHSPVGLELRYRGYHGDPLMSDYELYGTLLHRGDPYYRSPHYDRADISAILLRMSNVDCRVTASFHFTEGVMDNSQQIHVRLLF
jgi:hypothetical protein